MNFSDLYMQIPEDSVYIGWGEYNIAIKMYLPVNDKLELISWIINQSADELKFYNVGKLEIYKTIGLIKYYTDIKFSEKDLENIPHLYDLVVSSGFFNEFIEEFSESELE